MLEQIIQARMRAGMNEKNMALADAKLFQVYNRSESKSQATIEWYDLGLSILASPTRGLGPEIHMGAITEEQLRRYIVALGERRADGRRPESKLCAPGPLVSRD